MSQHYKIRAAQLDLGRQMESIDFIREFTDFIADNGYNTLFLYLEWRVRTESFACPADNECYTAQEMREIVKHAASRGIDVIPGLAALGHADILLKHSAYKPIGELADGRNGRFWNNFQHCVCPSNPGTLELLEHYFTEIADIFPSRHIHIGGDESWDIGYCDACAPKAATFKGEQELYLSHLKFCHKIISGRLGRRMMMWDDMFEYYQDALSELPRDIVLVNWQYKSDITSYNGHFYNNLSTHVLDTYDRLGFDYLIAPADCSSGNISTLTNYARRGRRLIGGFMTSWEKSVTFMHRSLPLIAYAGRLWRDEGIDSERLFRGLAEDLLGTGDELLVRTLWSICEGGAPPTSLSANSISYPCEGIDHGEQARRRMELAVLEGSLGKVSTKLGRSIVQDLMRRHKFNLAVFDAQLALRSITLGDTSTSALVDDAAKRLRALSQEYGEAWKSLRAGVKPENASAFYENCCMTARKMAGILSSSGLLRARFCLPDKYSAAQTRISLKYGEAVKEVACGVFKHMHGGALYEFIFPIDSKQCPDSVLVEVRGYGGQGLAYVEARVGEADYGAVRCR